MATAKAAQCATCGEDFPSRNKLFGHLKEPGHGAALSKGADKADGTGRQTCHSDDPQLAKGKEAYFEYNRRQRICNSDEEWSEAYDRLRRPLPISYRTHESSAISEFAAELLALVKKKGDGAQTAFQQWSIGAKDDASIPRLRMTVTNRFHRRNKKNRSKTDAPNDEMTSILHALQELGAVHRQELVSAIPPMVLWAKANAEECRDDAPIVADMCAAPGSKSLQLLDLLCMHSGAKQIPSGLLVANDSDRNRIVTLCQRTRHVPRAPLLAINTDARYFPGIRRKCHLSKDGIREKAGYKQKYDAVLCDVPCSGDGTARKNNQVWKDWSTGHAMSLHKLQRKILRRGMELLRPGGILVYSTCSLNPLENEAVVASVIGDVGGVVCVELVPLPDWLLEKCNPQRGLSAWQVPHPRFGKKGVTEMYQCFEDVPREHRGGEGKGKKGGQVTRSMFPPAGDSELSKQLRLCGRFLPCAEMDSGGFFVACIKRLHVGELRDKVRAPTGTSGAPNTPAAEELTKADATTGDDSSKDAEQSNAVELREGDWICGSCKELNFGRRGASRCFGCKARKPKSKTKENKSSPPLLLSVQQSILGSFVAFFGIESGPGSSFPVHNVRIIRRSKEQSVVLVSEALSRLAISENWSPVRELGISLAAFPNQRNGEAPNSGLQLFDEGLHVLTQHATRRHLKLQPPLFRIALAQSTKSLLASSPAAEVERVKGTLAQSLEVNDLLCKSNDVWHESFREEPLVSTWEECKASPGYFIVSCECIFPNSKGSTLAFIANIDADGSVAVKTSLRLAAAMLVLLNACLSEVLAGSSEDPPKSEGESIY